MPLYITKAFEIANKYAPNISLVFNQHGGMEPKMWDNVKKTILYLRDGQPDARHEDSAANIRAGQFVGGCGDPCAIGHSIFHGLTVIESTYLSD